MKRGLGRSRSHCLRIDPPAWASSEAAPRRSQVSPQCQGPFPPGNAAQRPLCPCPQQDIDLSCKFLGGGLWRPRSSQGGHGAPGGRENPEEACLAVGGRNEQTGEEWVPVPSRGAGTGQMLPGSRTARSAGGGLERTSKPRYFFRETKKEILSLQLSRAELHPDHIKRTLLAFKWDPISPS